MHTVWKGCIKMKTERINIIPGGMLSDVVEDNMNANQHQEVINLRQVKIGEWELVPGYINVFQNSLYTDIRSAIEVNEEKSGDRFILFQNGTSLYRITYDSGDGNGYENETPVEITLPSGVTIGSDAVLKFYYFRGVVRIIGASEPLWYGYVDRTLFPESCTSIIDSNLEDANGWSGTGATVTASAGAGTQLEGTNLITIAQSALDGYGQKIFTVESGKKYILMLALQKSVGYAEDAVIEGGSYAGGADYFTINFSDTAAQWHSQIQEFTAVNDTFYLKINPASGASSRTLWMDALYLLEKVEVIISEWTIQKAAVNNIECEFDDVSVFDNDGGAADLYEIRVKSTVVLDGTQNSLLEDLTNNIPLWSDLVWNGSFEIGGYKFIIPLGVVSAITNLRVTGVDLYQYSKVQDYLVYDEDSVYTLVEAFNFLTEIKPKRFTRQYLYYDGVNKYNLYMNHDVSNALNGSDGYILKARVPFKITISNSVGTITTYVVGVVVGVSSTPDSMYIKIADKVVGNIKSGATAGYLDADTGITVYRMWEYDSGDFKIAIPHDVNNLPETTYESMTGVPQNIEDISPNYDSYLILNDVAFCNSLEGEEQDVVRYSPEFQFDVFPNTNIIQTKTGDQDSNVAIVRRGDRFIIFKNKSFAQGSLSGATYFEDLGINQRGLYSNKGYIVIDDIIYFIDKDDVILFAGATPRQFLLNNRIRSLYQNYVDTSSFLLYDKINNELWLVLNGKILVYSFEKQEFYERETDQTLIGGFIDADNNLIAYSATKIVKYNHDESTYDESIRFYLKTRVEDQREPDKFKKVAWLGLIAQCNDRVVFNFEDMTELSQQNTILDFSSTDLSFRRAFFGYLYKHFWLEVYNHTSSDNLVARIRNITVNIKRW